MGTQQRESPFPSRRKTYGWKIGTKTWMLEDTIHSNTQSFLLLWGNKLRTTIFRRLSSPKNTKALDRPCQTWIKTRFSRNREARVQLGTARLAKDQGALLWGPFLFQETHPPRASVGSTAQLIYKIHRMLGSMKAHTWMNHLADRCEVDVVHPGSNSHVCSPVTL